MALDLHHGSATEQPPFSLPPYPQMIMEAIESLNHDKKGCNKTKIAKHIESIQHALPPSHSTLLSYHLNQMKSSGQLIMLKNNYMKPDPHAPPKRGRGRPPKLKTPPVSAVVAAGPPRSRGRPPKPKDPSEPSVTPKDKITSGSGRPRGRPPKRPRADSETVSDTAAPAPEQAAQSTGERRGRGRPPKVKTTVVAPVGC